MTLRPAVLPFVVAVSAGVLLLVLAGCPPFCGNSTYAECDSHDQCVAGGCSGQLCGHVEEELISTCEWRACYETDRPGLACGCYDGECQWSR